MPPSSPRLRRWQGITVGLLVVGYSGYYLCRSNLAVTLPLLVDELAASGMDADTATRRLGDVASLGVLVYAAGKFANGLLGDVFGGRRNFLTGMLGSVLFTLLFAAGAGVPFFTLAWIGNRFVQSMGWIGMVKITSRWFSFAAYGSVMGVISLSYLFGDAAARGLMGLLIRNGAGWRQVFVAAAVALTLLWVLCVFALRQSPEAVGEPEPEASRHNLFGEDGNQTTPGPLPELLLPFVRSRPFWTVCVLSLGFTFMRESFNTWTPTYFHDAVELPPDRAASWSAVFPLFGGLSVLAAGFVSDWIGARGRAAILALGSLATAGALGSLAAIDPTASRALPVVLVAVTGFLMIGPYSYLAGAIALDLGGKRGSGTACGVIDGVGYLGGAMAGSLTARLFVDRGWETAYFVLAAVAVASALAGCLLWLDERDTGRSLAAGPGKA